MNPARAIYGTILSTALIAAYSEGSGTDPVQVAIAVTTTALVFWIAHAYAEALVQGTQAGAAGPIATFGAGLRGEWGIVMGALPPVGALLLAPIGVLSDDGAETLALVTGIVLLTGWGAAAAWRRRPGLVSLALGAAASAFFGAVIVGLNALVH